MFVAVSGETLVQILPWASSGHVTTRSMSATPTLPDATFATMKLSTGANGHKEDAASFFCPRSFDQLSWVSTVLHLVKT